LIGCLTNNCEAQILKYDKTKNMELNLKQDITILGYSGAYLALLFESLSALNYCGKVTIIINEKEKRAVAPFETNISFSEIYYSDVELDSKNSFLICSNKPLTKKFLFNFYDKLWKINFEDFIPLVHPSSVISSSVIKSPGLQIEPLSVIAPYTKIGFGVNISRNCSIGHHNIINDYCSIYAGSNIAGFAEIGEGTTIGPGTTVFSNVKIGSNSIIGGGSVVSKDIPSNVLAYGNPCIVVKNLS
jgi:UDP-3-O-[3-hydroxymyristoyl] glucosamine N-acyltransferase